VYRFLEWVECKESPSSLNRLLNGRCLGLMRQQLGHGFERELAEALALPDQPLLEARFLHGQPFEEFTVVERGGMGQRLWCSLGHQLLEGGDIDLHRLPVHRDRLGIDVQ